MADFLKRKINTVFLMLGNDCNMNCRYCLQHPLVHEQLSSDINPQIFDFLKECADELNGKLHIQFYGGEPLIYFDAIKEVVTRCEKFCWFSVITNGKAVTDEMDSFFNEHEIPVTVSWDGDNVLLTRGFDVFADGAPQRERLLQIKKLGLTAVMSSIAYPQEILTAFQRISDAYYKLHGYHVNINIDEVFDTGCLPNDLLAVDYDRVEREMFVLAKKYLAARIGNVECKNYAELAYIDRFFGMLKSFYVDNDGVYSRNYCSCGNGYTVLNLDLAGKLYPCHNTSTSIGCITDDYFAYLNRLLASDPTMRNKEQCAKCAAVAFCRGGCKLVGDVARADGYCRLKKAVVLPVMAAFEQYGSKLIEGDADGG